MRKHYVLYRFYAAFLVIAIGVLINIFVHKGGQWAWIFYVLGVGTILWDIFIGPYDVFTKTDN
jgi:hypothetical protein